MVDLHKGSVLGGVGNQGYVALDRLQNDVSFGCLDTLEALDHTVELLQTFGRIDEDLQNEVVITGDTVAGDDIGGVVDEFNEGFQMAGVVDGNLHHGRNVVADLFLVDDQGILVDDAALLQLLDTLGDGRN